MASNDFYADGQGAGDVVYKPSSHQFTDPIRLFKANDPYYWEVDNVPLQQVHENILWLKDQIAGDTTVEGFTRADFSELRPEATGDSRSVRVSPGRFTGRVNDAYKTGISTLVLKAAASIDEDTINHIEITTPVDTMKSVAGAIVTNILADNGLYDTVQHNVTSPSVGLGLDWTNTYTSFKQNDKSAEAILDLQKNKLALWKQGTTVRNYGGEAGTEVGLQQLAVEFTRVYGSPFRTAVVNVPSTLSIDIPSFDNSDYQNSTTYIPSVRVDLLVVYTKPIDASATTILQPNGTGPTKLNSPSLGLVKGAGVIALNPKPDGSIWSGKTLDEEFFESSEYTDNVDNGNLYFEASGAFDALGNRQTTSVISDLNQNSIGVGDTFANFPSPDDLLNAAPYITDGVAKNNLSLVGQSVLPLAYIFVKKDKAVIETSDILDIRPFFRTAELTYNERAGLAAANPPTSLANPVVSKYELADNTRKLKAFIGGTVSDIPDAPRPVGAGYVFGGVRYGPEGSLIRIDYDSTAQSQSPYGFTGNVGSLDDISTHLKNMGLLPNIPGNVPEYPDWDLPDWTQSKENPGVAAVDRFHFWYQNGDYSTYHFDGDDDFSAKWGPHVDRLVWSTGAYYGNAMGSMSFYVKKRIDLDKSQVPWMTDYDVKTSFVNCSLASTDAKFENSSGGNDQDNAIWKQPQGLYIEKYADHFNIICCWVQTGPWRGNYMDGPGKNKKNLGSSPASEQWLGTSKGDSTPGWAGVFVTSENVRHWQKNAKTAKLWSGLDLNKMERNAACIYPTIKYEITGYPSAFTEGIKMDAGTNSTITLTSS